MMKRPQEEKNTHTTIAHSVQLAGGRGASLPAVPMVKEQEDPVLSDPQPDASPTFDAPSVPIQAKTQDSPLQAFRAPVQKKNDTGLPDQMKAGVENLSGYSMDNVKVHYNSPKPAQLQAHAYAQGTDIHVAPGQEQHLAHEAWHVVQQKQGKVQATRQMKSNLPVNDDPGLEKEADEMGAKALSAFSMPAGSASANTREPGQVAQRWAAPSASQSAPIQLRGEFRQLNDTQRDEIETFAEVGYHNASTQFETRLGHLASIHPKAMAAADALTTGALALVLQHLGPTATLTQLAKVFGTDQKGNTGSVGREEDAIRAIFEEGNFREKMTAVYNAYANRQLAPIISDSIVHQKDQDLGSMFNRPDDLMRDRTERKERDKPDRRTKQLPDEVQFPPLSEREENFGVEEGELQWEPGMQYFYFELMSNYAQEARQLRVPYGGGRSGTAYIMLKAAMLLGVPDLYDMRLAVLGWMITAGDHTFYEIMVAAKEFGLEYVEGPLGYRLVKPLQEDELRGLMPEGRLPDEYLDDDYKDELAQNRFPAQQPQQLKAATGDTSDVIQGKFYYHGRPDTRERVEGGIERNIMTMIESSRTGLDFDPDSKGGFYLTPDETVASNWSKRKAERTRADAKKKKAVGPDDRPIPTLFSYDVDEKDMTEKLKGRKYKTKVEKEKIEFENEDEKKAWQEHVLTSRMGRKKQDLDFVEGPMISNPVAATGIVRKMEQKKGKLSAEELLEFQDENSKVEQEDNGIVSPDVPDKVGSEPQKKQEEKKLSLEQLAEVAHEHVRWDPAADQIALYTQAAADIFEAGKKPRKILDWEDRDYEILEVRASLKKNAADKRQLKEILAMPRDQRAWFLYNNRLFSESLAAKEVFRDTANEALKVAFPVTEVRSKVWEESYKLDHPPGSIMYEYDRLINGSPPDYDFKKLSVLPGVAEAMEVASKTPVPEKEKAIPVVKPQTPLIPLGKDAVSVFEIIYRSKDQKAALPDSRNEAAVKDMFNLTPDDFMTAYRELQALKLAHHDKLGPFLTKAGKKEGLNRFGQ